MDQNFKIPQMSGSERENDKSPYQTQEMMQNPAFLECPRCDSLEYRVILDQADTGFCQFICANARCGGVFPVFELHAPKMTNDVHQRIQGKLGLWTPNALSVDIDLPSDGR